MSFRIPGIVFGLVCAALMAATATANAAPSPAAFAVAPDTAPIAEPAQGTSIFVGQVNFRDRWKCTAYDGYTSYVATGSSETKARRKLLDYGLTQISCRYRSRF